MRNHYLLFSSLVNDEPTNFHPRSIFSISCFMFFFIVIQQVYLYQVLRCVRETITFCSRVKLMMSQPAFILILSIFVHLFWVCIFAHWHPAGLVESGRVTNVDYFEERLIIRSNVIYVHLFLVCQLVCCHSAKGGSKIIIRVCYFNLKLLRNHFIYISLIIWSLYFDCHCGGLVWSGLVGWVINVFHFNLKLVRKHFIYLQHFTFSNLC